MIDALDCPHCHVQPCITRDYPWPHHIFCHQCLDGEYDVDGRARYCGSGPEPAFGETSEEAVAAWNEAVIEWKYEHEKEAKQA